MHRLLTGTSHPLQELTVPSFVANDTCIVGGAGENSQTVDSEQTAYSPSPSQSAWRDGPSMVLLTGPNYSGKSVHLKQVAIITFMAHIGR